jgi:hypothetical protein
MSKIARFLLLIAFAFCMACTSVQPRFSFLDKPYPEKPADFDVQLFRDSMPTVPFKKIARVEVHVEKTGFHGSSLEEVLGQLKEQARLAGADALIEFDERRSMIGETRVYHVIAIGIVFS